MKTRWKVAAASALSLGMTFLDQTGINVALPSIQAQLHLSPSMLHWVINAYLLLLAACLVMGGTLGDRFSKKTVFITGVGLFGLSSAFCAIAPSGMLLILGRALQGVGGALMIPNSMAITLSLFPDKMRGKVIGTLLSFTSIFLILGPFVGGILTEYVSWHSIFWLNVPVSLIGMAMMAYYCPSLTANKQRPIDWPGFGLFVIMISSIVYALMEGMVVGWSSPLILGLLALGIITFIAFIRYELTVENPFVQLKVFKNSVFNRAVFIFTGTQMVFMLGVFMPIYMQHILGFSPIESGTLSIISLLPVMLLSRYAGSLRDRYGPRYPMRLGLLFLVIGTLWIALSLLTYNIWFVFPGFFGFSCSAPFIFGNANTTAVAAVPKHYHGIASGITACCRQLGATLSMAILSVIMVSINHHYSAANSHFGYTLALSVAAGFVTLIGITCYFVANKLPGTDNQTATHTSTKLPTN